MPVDLPLLDRPARHGFSLRVESPIPSAPPLMPGRPPGPGEQYRFHFDMTKCIGCKCCVVACNEQNGNPAHLNWRRVGEIEGGVYPEAHRWHLSMSCNHCLEPSCLIGCPVEAYSKDALTGIVDHDPEICIGCQYCVWNCSYGAPQYNPERGVVGKCDMCHGRISRGQTPACVSACPEGAIEIELVDVASWRERRDGADGPGLPPSSDSVSTTRVTLPEAPGPLARVDLGRIRPQDPHWSLVFFLVFTQLAVGAVGALWLLEVTSASLPAWSALAPLIFAAFSLAAAPAHLGRPIYAYRAMRSWRRSWISREIIALSAFAAALGWYAASLWFGSPFSALAGGASLLFGVSGVVSSARIYMAPARPAWNMDFTQVEFLLTCAVLGPRLVLCMGLGGEPWLLALAAAATLLQIAVGVARLWKLSGSPAHELRGAATLALRGKRDVLLARLACAALSVALLPLEPVLGMLSALAGEVAARYLFFTAVVPKSIASTYLTPKGEAA